MTSLRRLSNVPAQRTRHCLVLGEGYMERTSVLFERESMVDFVRSVAAITTYFQVAT